MVPMIRRYSITLFVLAVISSIAFWSPGGGFAADAKSAKASSAAGTGGAPEALFIESIYRFASVMEGVEIKHDFYVENRGDAPLVIEKVQPD